MHKTKIWHLQSVTTLLLSSQGAERKMRDEERKRSKRRGKNDAGEFTWLPLNTVSKEKRLMLWTFLCFSPADKSIVSSSISSECTFFQTLDDHVTHPVLFIPETHISSMQRTVGPALRNSSLLNSWISHDLCVPAGMRRARGGKNGGKICRGKRGLGRGGYGVSRFKQQRWANWSRNQTRVHAATATDTELQLWGRMQTHAGT